MYEQQKLYDILHCKSKMSGVGINPATQKINSLATKAAFIIT